MAKYAVALTLLVAGCGAPDIEKSFAVDGFQSVRAVGALDLSFVWAEDSVLRISGPAEALAQFSYEVTPWGLSLKSSSDDPGLRIAAEITMPALAVLELMGDARAEIGEIRGAESLRVSAYGNSELKMGRVDTLSLDVRGSGAGRIALDHVLTDEVVVLGSGRSEIVMSGQAERGQIDTGGDVRLAAGELRVQYLDIHAGANSDAEVWATAHIGGAISGSSTLTVRGLADRSVDVAGDARLLSRQ